MVVIRGYIDASGSDVGGKRQAIAAGGYTATVGDWMEFEREWTDVLHRFGLQQFSMEDLAHFTAQFSPWAGKERRRIELLTALIAVAKPRVLSGHVVGMRQADFDVVNAEFKVQEAVGGPYAMCSAVAALRLRSCPAVDFLEPEYFEVLAEEGDVNQALLFKLLDRNPVRFRVDAYPKKFEDDGGGTSYVRAFELADMLAYEHRLHIERLGTPAEYKRELPKILEEELTIDAGWLGAENMRVACESFGVPRRAPR